MGHDILGRVIRQVACGQRPEHSEGGGSRGMSLQAEEVARLWGERVWGWREGVGKEGGRVKGEGAGARKGEGERKEGTGKEGDTVRRGEREGDEIMQGLECHALDFRL